VTVYDTVDVRTRRISRQLRLSRRPPEASVSSTPRLYQRSSSGTNRLHASASATWACPCLMPHRSRYDITQ
jgi:hypothetical protein